METNDYHRRSESSSPIDLSRRRDSVETRKTPSPYNSSTFGGSSPSVLNDSPSTARQQSNHSSTSSDHHHIHSLSPVHHYPSNHFIPNFHQTTSNFATLYDYQRKSRSPPHSDDLHHRELPLHHSSREFVTSTPITPSTDEIHPYFLHAVALQQKLVQSQLLDRQDSMESVKSLPAAMPIQSGHPAVSTASYPMVMGRDGKLARPFKAYPRDPLSISSTITASEAILDRTSTEKFNAFRKQMLDQIHAANGGQPTISNPKMRRTTTKSLTYTSDEEQMDQKRQPAEASSQNDSLDSTSTGENANNNNNTTQKDSAYYERRKKNNAAAKKSRDRRRIKEDEIAIRAAFLERENIELRIELAATKRQLSKFIVT